MKRLVDLDPEFIRYGEKLIATVGSLAEAQGLWFECPKCPNGHFIAVTLADRGVGDEYGTHDRSGKPSRWTASGVDFSDLTLKPSVDSGCGWHGWITNGEATEA